MVVCKFFLQGCCKFGNNCNFDHPRNQGYQSQQTQNRYQSSNQAYDSNRFKFVSNSQTNQSTQSSQSTNLFTKLVSSNQQSSQPTKTLESENIVSDQDFLNFITNDFKVWLNSSLWKLSCYSYDKVAPCLPLLTDVSPEEVRYMIYEAKKHNRHNEELHKFEQKYNQTIDLLNQIANPNQQMKDYLLNYFRTSKNKTASQISQSQPASVNLFQQIAQNKQPHQQQPQKSQQSLQNQFNLPVQNFLQSQQQTQIQSSGTTLFTSQTKPNLFSQLINTNKPVMIQPINMNHESFNNLSSLKTQPSIFSTASTTFTPVQVSTLAQSPPQQSQPPSITTSSTKPNNIYSIKTELSEQDLNEFQSNKFTIGKVPHFPPPREICFL